MVLMVRDRVVAEGKTATLEAKAMYLVFLGISRKDIKITWNIKPERDIRKGE